MPAPSVVVSGATGRLGSRVAARLAAAGVAQRLLVRDPSRAPVLPRAEVARAEFRDRAAVRDALAGVPTVLMVSAAESADRLDAHYSFLDAATDAGVEHLVYVSFVGATPDATFTLVRQHWATEQRIRDTSLRWTLLRDNLYADFVPLLAGPDGVIRGPAGDGRAAVVGQDDIADAAAAVLRSPGEHAGRTYDLTGPEALSLGEMAEALSTVIGRAVTYQPETVEEAYASRAQYGAPDWQVTGWVTTYTAIAAGELAEVSDDIATLTGHPATPLEDVLRSDPSTYRHLVGG